MTQKSKTTVANHLLSRLYELGLRHIFGVPGDYALDFLDKALESPIKYVGNCNELNAGYAADAYARIKGIGAAIVTYGVGGFSAINSVAGAYAEQVPLVLISGAPASAQRKSRALVHHLTKDYGLQFEIYKKITVDAIAIANPAAAPVMIDRVLRSCVVNKRPVYIEIPVDMVGAECEASPIFDICEIRHSDPESLDECVEEAASLILSAKNPVLLAGVEIDRFNLASHTLRLVEKAELPFATTLSSKSVLPELHPQFIGVYNGAYSGEKVREQIESSDALLSLGVWMTDLNTGIFTAKLPEDRMICVNSENARIKKHYYHDIRLGDFIAKLAEKLPQGNYLRTHPVSASYKPAGEFSPVKNAKLSAARFYDRINRFLDDSMILVPETGDAICAAPEFFIQEARNMLCQAYYLSIGYALPAVLGASLAAPEKRCVLLVGDGAFQMTAQELSTIMREKCNPIIFLINNEGYTIERLIHDGPYNDINNWKYAALPSVFGENFVSCEVRTEGELENALEMAQKTKDRLVFIELHIGQYDCSKMLSILGSKFRKLSV